MGQNYKTIIAEKKKAASGIMDQSQIKKCNVAIHTASAASAAAGAIPLPVVDAVPITACQVTMVLALGKIFGRKITETAAKGAIGAAAATLIGRNIIKLIPFAGWVASAAIAAGVTEAIGWTIAVDLAQKAKLEWESDYHIDVPEYGSEVIDEASEEVDSKTQYEILKERSAPFLSKEKTQDTDKDEYDSLLKDFEKILDDLPEDDPLRKTYDDLTMNF